MKKALILAILPHILLCTSCTGLLFSPSMTEIDSKEMNLEEVNSIKGSLLSADSFAIVSVNINNYRDVYKQSNDFSRPSAKVQFNIESHLYNNISVRFVKYVNEIGITKEYRGYEVWEGNRYISTKQEYIGYADEDYEDYKEKYYLDSSYMSNVFSIISSGVKGEDNTYGKYNKKNYTMALEKTMDTDVRFTNRIYHVNDVSILNVSIYSGSINEATVSFDGIIDGEEAVISLCILL